LDISGDWAIRLVDRRRVVSRRFMADPVRARLAGAAVGHDAFREAAF
jgi:hypothetical protein